MNDENLKPFVKADPRINRKGRPKKLVSTVLDELAAEGYVPITKAQVEMTYKNMISLGEDKLREIGMNKELPMIFRILAREILKTRGFDVVERMIDRVHGKPKENLKVDGEVKVALVEFYESPKDPS